MPSRRKLILYSLLSAAIPACRTSFALPRSGQPILQLMARSDYQWTGVAVSREGRIFVSFPTRSEFPSFHVGELRAGAPQPFPSRDVNESFTNVNGVQMDSRNHLWVLDSGKLLDKPIDSGSAKLVEIDVQTRSVVGTYPIPPRLLLPESSPADFRIDPDGRYAYVSDGGAAGLIVMDLKEGEAWLGLDRTVPQTRANASFIACTHGNYRPLMPHLNGITLSDDNTLLYFTPLIATRIWSIPTRILKDRKLSSRQRTREIRTVTSEIFPSAGMVERKGQIYLGDVRHNRLAVLDAATGKVTFPSIPSPIRFADDFVTDFTGDIWFTDSQESIPVSSRSAYRLFRLQWPR
ncbi:MAG: L-dopachrome tautomerase-related protein [Sutterellaceae bacterium]|nr:L-dopachrome tautomerase-related protein [Sutterellaceae bacterium]MDY2867627.1 L-dopachrome tautomerase-related protein [Mesosutterella sp.]